MACSTSKRARQVLSSHKLWLRLARLEQHAGILLCELGRFEEATSTYDRALEAARQLEPRDPPQEARITGNLALAWQRLGEYERAERLHAEAVAVFAQHGHAQELALAKANSAQLLADQGHYSRALEMATSARRTLHELGHMIDAAFVGRAAAHCLLELNRLDEAVTLASVVADEFATAGAAISQAATLLLKNGALRRLERFDEALAELDRAQAIFSASKCDGWVAVVRGERAANLSASGMCDEAVEEAEAAARELLEQGQLVSAAQASLVHGAALRATGSLEAAADVVDQALARVRGRGVPWLEYEAWRLAAELAVVRAEPEQALTALDAAIAALEQVQGRILTEARAQFLMDKLEVYEWAVALSLERGEHGRALEYAERAKSRALVDALAGQLDISIRPRTSTEHRLAAELTRLRRRHDQLSAAATATTSTGGHDEPAPPEFPDELVDCERQITALLDELRLANVADLERLALLQGQVYPLELDPDTRLVEYFTVGDDLCVFAGSPWETRGLRLGGARRRVERMTRQLHLALQTAAAVRLDEDRLKALDVTTRRLLGALHAELVAPVSEWIEGAERLVVVPHGVLHRLPFAALHDGVQYLVQRYELVIGPSASALAFCLRRLERADARALVVGHGGDGTLPGALREAEEVAALLDGECLLEDAATRSAFTERARHADIIHLATHGYARVDAPLFSHLRLADCSFTALDCFELELDCALVTLSACESGWAEITAGDEQLGLPRALLYAGARSVVQTLWRVDDETTVQLMERFYAAVRSGRGRAAALREAQLHVLANTPGRSHPFFWAPVVLIGNWQPLSR